MYLDVFVLMLVAGVNADYDCVCNYKVEAEIHDNVNNQGSPIGYMYEFDCKPTADQHAPGNFYQIMYEGQIGYIEKGDDVEVQICQGEIPPTDIVTTRGPLRTTTITPAITTPSTTATTTHSTPAKTTPSTSATTTPSTPATTTPSTTATTTTSTPAQTTPSTTATTTPSTPATTMTQTAQPVLEGRTDLCPDNVKKTHFLHHHGELGQYGKNCYELVTGRHTQMVTAERQCNLVPGGHLASIVNHDEQSYILRLLANNKVTDPVWIGLTDAGTGTEGTWRWTSGETYSYNNFGSDFAHHSSLTHKNDDCIVVLPGGDWTDLPCGISLIFGAGIGEHHPYICQYNISATNLPTPHPVLGVLVG